MANWRRARSLVVLGNEIHAFSPSTIIYDIGDAAHAATASDHNANKAGVVCAIDIMQGNGLDLARLAQAIVDSNHPDLKYVIYNRRIWSKARVSEGWRSYKGADPHTNHIHVSVGVGSDGKSVQPYDDEVSWGITSGGTTLFCKYGDKGPVVLALQALLLGLGYTLPKYGADSGYGNEVAAALRAALGDPNADGMTFGPWEYAAILVRNVGGKTKDAAVDIEAVASAVAPKLQVTVK